MTTPMAPIPPITGTVTLAVPVERAFAVFTGSVNAWWPHQFHIGRADVAEVVLESWVGGRWFERGMDGSEGDWGRVLVWEPPHRLIFTWQIGSWQFDPDPDSASEIEARFTASGPQESVVLVEHRGFETPRRRSGHPGCDQWGRRLDASAGRVRRRGGGSVTRVVRPDYRAMAVAERADIADLVGSLTPEEWEAPTLCQGWRVGDVVAHMFSYEELRTAGLASRMVRGRFTPGGPNALGLAALADRSPDELVALCGRISVRAV